MPPQLRSCFENARPPESSAPSNQLRKQFRVIQEFDKLYGHNPLKQFRGQISS